MQAGSSGAAFDQRPAPPLAPGAALAISLLTGDADLSAVGTVTEVIGDRILAFGHPFFDEGDVEFPMGKAYIHTVIPSILQSFKLTSASDLAGSLIRDESTGVIGMLGKSASMIPQTITVDWKSSGRSRQFNYMLARHRTITPLLAAITVLESSSSSWHDLPDLHTIRYDVQVDCEGLGSYRAANISSGAGYSFVISDLLRPLAAIMNNPFTVPPNIKDLKVNVSIESRQRTASILKLELDGRIYRPGETITGKLTYRPFRAEKTTMDVQFKLPDDLKDGNYTITACDSEAATQHMISEMPQRFHPRNLQELFQAIQRLVENKADNVYLRMQLPRRGVALESRELTDLPASRTRILMEQDRQDRDINQFTPAIVTSTPGEYVFAGSAQAEFTVQRNSKETLIRE